MGCLNYPYRSRRPPAPRRLPPPMPGRRRYSLAAGPSPARGSGRNRRGRPPIRPSAPAGGAAGAIASTRPQCGGSPELPGRRTGGPEDRRVPCPAARPRRPATAARRCRRAWKAPANSSRHSPGDCPDFRPTKMGLSPSKPGGLFFFKPFVDRIAASSSHAAAFSGRPAASSSRTSPRSTRPRPATPPSRLAVSRPRPPP